MKYFIGICFSFLLHHSYAQIYSLKHFTQDDGLNSPYIYDIVQDEKGFLNIATGAGLTTYDGTRFKTSDTSNGLGNNIITCLMNDSQGTLVVGQLKNGICRRNGSSFKSFDITKNISNPISCLLTFNKKIIFGTKNGSLILMDDGKTESFVLEGAGFLNKLIQLKDKILLATDNGIYVFDGKKSIYLITSTKGIHFTSFCSHSDQKLLAGTDDGEVYVFKVIDSDNTLELLTVNKVSRHTAIKSIVRNNENKFVMASWGNGIYFGTLEETHSNIINLKNISSENGLNDLFVNSVFKDFNENVWIGTFGGGLYKFSNSPFKVYNKKSGLSEDRVKSVFTDRNRIYIGLEEGLQVLNTLKSDSLLVYNFKNRFVDDKVTSIAKLNSSNLVIGTATKGLFIYDLKKQNFKNYFQTIKLNSQPKNINHVQVGKDSNVYISTVDGLFIHNLKNGELKKLTTDQGLPHNNILSTFLDSQKRLWFVAPKSAPGLIVNDSIILYKDIPNFTSYNITSICEGLPGHIYITTNGDGFYSFKRDRFEQFKTANGLVSDYVLNAVFDKNTGLLICSHQSGFSIYDITKNTIRSAANKGNLNAFTSNINSIAIENSTVYFGTEEGLGVYNITEEKTQCLPPKISILKIKINDKEYTQTDSIIFLPFDYYDFQIDYIGVELTFPEKVVYTLKLDGVEKSFKITSDQSVEYNKVVEGTYTFILYANNYLGIGTPAPIRLKIIIDKPFYKKWWFWCIVLLVCSALVYYIVHQRMKKLIETQKILQQKVKERTQDIVNINKVLEAKNSDITSSIDYALRIQNVLLPKIEHIKKGLDAFVYLEPRDIVSGDFYWFHDTKKYSYIAAVDCTGHGVPGAFMSIIGTFFLDELVNELKDPSPSQIVDQLNKRVVKSLKQNDQHDGVADGMDIALCRIDKQTKEIMFCGAHRPLYLVNANEIIELESTKYSIGGFAEDLEKEFHDQILTYQKNDMIYLFSDGLVDQFGGEQNRRFSSKNVRLLFKSIFSKDMELQREEVIATIANWKNGVEQTDDILVIGIKL